MTAAPNSAVKLVGPDGHDEWNQFVTNHPHGHFMQLWQWGEVRKSSGWRPHYFALDGPDGIDAVALVLERQVPGFGTLLYTPRGPLWRQRSPGCLSSLATVVRDFARARGGVVWRADPYIAESECAERADLVQAGFRPADMPWSYWNQPRYIMRLDTGIGSARILESMDRKDRYQVRHAAKEGVVFAQVPVDDAHMGHAYRLMQATAHKKGIPLRDYSSFSCFLRTFSAAGHAALFLAQRGSVPVSAGASVIMGRTAWLFHLGSDYSVRNANWGLQWHMLCWAIDSGCTTYDFRGSATNFPPQPTDKGYGVYLFKRSFGAQLVPLVGYFDLVFGPTRYRALRYAEHRLLPLGERAMEGLAALRRIRST